MNIKSILRKDLLDKRIADKVNNNIYFLHKPEGKKTDTYIEYHIVRENYSDFCADDNLTRSYLIQVSIFSKSDYVELEEIIKSVLKEKGYRYDYGADMYEEDTSLYHCALRFNKKIFNKDLNN